MVDLPLPGGPARAEQPASAGRQQGMGAVEQRRGQGGRVGHDRGQQARPAPDRQAAATSRPTEKLNATEILVPGPA